MSIEQKLDNLENKGMIDQMYHEVIRFHSVKNYINRLASWEVWIRK